MKTAVVICPGRGTYNKAELAYLKRYFPDPELLAAFDAQRSVAGQETVSALNNAPRFSMAKHTRGDNASALIYAATLGDFLSLDRSKVDVVAVTGNSMGWYSALACAGALSAQSGFTVANTMGTAMQASLIGGQLVYPFMDENWQPDPPRRAALMAVVDDINRRKNHILRLSIALGGMLVLAGDEAGLAAFEAEAEPLEGRFPMRLGNHAAFHTDLQEPVAIQGRAALAPDLFSQPELPMVDGRGAIWWPHSSSARALRDYTLGAQVTQTYDFTRAIEVAAREFAPDLFIITGPGTAMGGAVAQSLILANWRGMDSKESFKAVQDKTGMIVSMGMTQQRALVMRNL